MSKISLDTRNYNWVTEGEHINCYDGDEVLFHINTVHSVQEATLRTYMTGLQRGIHRGRAEKEKEMRYTLGIKT